MDRHERAWDIARHAQPGSTDAELDELVQMGLEIADVAYQAAHAHPLAKAGPMTLHGRGISFAVDGDGEVLRYPNGEPIEGTKIEDVVNRSGRRLTNAQAAGQLVAARAFVGQVKSKFSELETTKPVEGEVVDDKEEK